ncbi:putative NmrA-like family protein [Aspergillus aculeatinus CBS 121060]|uniref:NAD(P)-binding protein n=1 Tax=Aspergillus aculeatinus CBS 121060 TaxID=1448322 RepID=A0ACD1HJC1_9EURO|nr:NAD(P)-binding protein [Aspergillus aculeatinus CBS 121060]RAH73944.1 NAD(P)-binding protein [Aspergillus aculeatinus CBS 121060]
MVQYLLTGVTGGLGAHVLEYFLAHVEPSTYAVASSNRAKADEFTRQGLAFRVVNYDDPSTLDAAFQEVENLFFVSSNTFDNERRRRQHQDVVDAAKRAGVKHIWYTSLAFGGHTSTSQVAVQQAHYMTEEMLRVPPPSLMQSSSGIPYTSIREGLYTEAFPLYFNWYPTTKTIILPQPPTTTTTTQSATTDPAELAHTQRITFTSREELGHATARLLLRGGAGYRDQIVVLSARETLSFQQIVDLINAHHCQDSRKVGVEFVPAAEYVARNAADDEGGKAAGFFEAMVSWHEGIAKGEAVVDSEGLMAEVLGREPTPALVRIEELLRGAKGQGGQGGYVWHQNYA